MVSRYILIGADVVPTESNQSLFISGDTKQLLGEELAAVVDAADYRIYNLEVPLTDRLDPIRKLGPHLAAPEATAAGYKSLGADLLTLANNHILDHGAQGLNNTIETLDKAGIAHLGTGNDLAEASRPYIFEFAGKRIGVYACAEHEFSIAGEAKPGANPFDPLYSLDHVEAIKAETDFVIVLFHGGKEHYPYPSPNLQKICRRLIDKGADLIICQHTHCIGSEEKYGHGTIVYGQGNFIFDGSKRECWQTSLLIRLDEDLSVSYVPIVKKQNTVRLASGEKKQEILTQFTERSEAIKENGFIEAQYRQFSKQFAEQYFRAFGGKESWLFKAVNRLSHNKMRMGRIRRRYQEKQLLGLKDYVGCEAHQELVLALIEAKLSEQE